MVCGSLRTDARYSKGTMTPLGWIFLISSLAFVWGLTGWCFYKVLTVPGEIEKPPDTLGG